MGIAAISHARRFLTADPERTACCWLRGRLGSRPRSIPAEHKACATRGRSGMLWYPNAHPDFGPPRVGSCGGRGDSRRRNIRFTISAWCRRTTRTRAALACRRAGSPSVVPLSSSTSQAFTWTRRRRSGCLFRSSTSRDHFVAYGVNDSGIVVGIARTRGTGDGTTDAPVIWQNGVGFAASGPPGYQLRPGLTT